MSYLDMSRAPQTMSVDAYAAQPTRVAETMLLKLANHISALKKLVEMLGGARDTIEHRHRIADNNSTIQDLAKQLKETLSNMHDTAVTDEAKRKNQKLLQDFAALLQDYKGVQKQAQEREASSLPKPSPASRQAAAAVAGAHLALAVQDSDNSDRTALMQAQQTQMVAAREAEIAHNEALITERDAGIRHIVRQIGEVNEMFQDLAVLINDQGVQVRTIDEHITSTAERSKEGSRELVKAERSQRAARNRCLWLWLIAALTVSLIIVVTFA